MSIRRRLPVLILASIILAAGLAAGGFSLLNRRIYEEKNSEEVHYHAGFRVFIDGRLEDFSQAKYMQISPCTTNDEEIKKDQQLEKAHLHDNVGDVVHVHREGALWGDLFKNLGFEFPGDKKISGYTSGKSVPDILAAPIIPYDSVIIISGESEGVDINQSVSYDRIREVEQKSESCS